MGNQQPAGPMSLASSTPAAAAAGSGGTAPVAAAAEAAAEGPEITPELLAMLLDFLGEDPTQADAQAAAQQQPAAAAPAGPHAAGYHPAAAQQQQQQAAAYFAVPRQQVLLQPQYSSDNSSCSAGSDMCYSSRASAGFSPSGPSFAAQQAARVVDIPYIAPNSSFRPQTPGAFVPPQALQQLLPTPLAAGELLQCVDMTVAHTMQLYTRLTAQPLQHAGHTAVMWLAGVRAQHTALLSSGAAAPPAVSCAAMHVCASLVFTAAEPPGGVMFGPFNCSFLLVVLELLADTLLSLRGMCVGVHPATHLSGAAMHAWRQALRAQAHTKAGEAVAAVLSFL
jgi:hypothetical protein